jgi:prolipoprotein diacylglyceryltransferase
MGTFLLPTLPTAIGGWPAYALFYLLGFGLAGGMLVAWGWRRYPWQPWLLLIAGTVLALIAGTRVAAGTAADWQALLTHGHWGTGAPLGRTVLGGMLAAVLALAGLRRWLGFGRSATDAFALPLLLGLALQGVGCLLAGCCYGELLGSGPGLGISYPVGSEPWAAQVAQGLLAPTATSSLPVHAAPLYQVLLCLGIAGTLVAGRKKLALRPGVALPLALGLFAAGRFGLESWRAPLGDVLGAGLWHGLKPVQWGLAAASLALLLLAKHRYTRGVAIAPTQEKAAAIEPVPSRPLVYLALMVALLVLPSWLLPGQITIAETLVLRALLLPVLVMEALRWGRALRMVGPLPAALLALSFALMSQAPAPTAPASAFAEPAQSLTVSASGLTGSSYQLYRDYSTCSTPQANITTFPGYHQRYNAATLGAAFTQRLSTEGDKRLTFGLAGTLGTTSFDPPAGQLLIGGQRGDSAYVLNAATSHRLTDLNPYFEYTTISRKQVYLRLGLGAHLSRQLAYDYVIEPLRSRGPQAGFLVEFGAAHLLWAHLSNAYGPEAVGNGLYRLGLGTSFGRDRLTLLAGATGANSNTYSNGWFNLFILGQPSYTAPTGFYLQARWQATPAWLLEGSATSNFNDMSQLTLGTRYRLPLGSR